MCLLLTSVIIAKISVTSIAGVMRGYMLKVDCNSLRDTCSCSDHVTSFFGPGQLRVGLGLGEDLFFSGPPARADQLNILTLNWKD